MKKVLFILFAFAIGSIYTVQAQQQSTALVIKGKVTDKNDKYPIPGASVIEVDKDSRTIGGVSTDIDGNFVLKIINPKNHLAVSFIGYQTTSLNLSGRDVINIQLVPSDNQLTEVSITARKNTDNGTGLNIEDRNRTTATATISAKDLEEMQAASIDQALQGRLPGVDIAASSGDPGAGMQIRIRGTSSINAGTDPLIVVDGMPYETAVSEDFNFATADEQGYAQLLNIAPTDIKDISVLKDAAATAVWGARAANGVLIINTKRGAIGTPSITYAFKGSLSHQPAPIPLLNGGQYSQLIPEAFMNRNGVPLNTQTIKEFSYDKKDPYYYYNYNNNTDWVSAITQTGYVQDHNMSISGGGDRARYYASFGYFNQKGTTIGTDLGRVSARINLDYTVSDRLKFRTDFAYTHIDNNQLFTGQYDVGVRDAAYKKMPNMAIYEYDEYGNQTPNFFSPEDNIQGYFYYDDNGRIKGTYNPVAMASTAKNQQIGERIIPKFNFQYDIIPSLLKATSDIQFDINTSKVNTFLPQIATGRSFTETVVNRATDADNDAYSVQTKTNLVFTPTLKPNHTLIGLLSFQTSDLRYVDQQIMTSNTASSNLQDPSSGSRTEYDALKISSSKVTTRSIGAVANAQYGYLDRYIINGSLRMDANSRFGPAHRYGLFPAVSARWRISGEPFLKEATFINDLSLRLSYGETGNIPRKDYTFYNKYGNYTWSYMGQSGVYSQNIELTNLRWETVIGKNIGFNLNTFSNRLNIDVDLYRNRTKDMIYPGLQLMGSSGFSTVDMNVGVMDNQGWEINLSATPVKNKNLQVGFNFNMAHNENMIRSISPLYPRENNKKSTDNGVYKSYLQENNPFGSFYGYRYQGVYTDKASTIAVDEDGVPITGLNGEQIFMRFNYPAVDYVFQPGDAKYEDINHDGTIDYRDIVYLGNSNPKLTGGFGPNITIKNNLKISAFFSFRYGNDLINGTKMTTTNMYSVDNQSTAVLRRWRNEGDVTDIPRALYKTGYNWLGSDRYVEDGSFLRWRTLTVRYDFDKNQIKGLGLNGLGIFVIGENIMTLTHYTGQDPEVAIKIKDAFTTLVDNSMTPPVRTITLGINAKF